ncbi:MAG: flagellar hook-associated protein FlgK [Phycisphaerae bacterium]
MANWGIGITGLQAAQAGIETIGMNIANASTDGYHKQDLQLASIAYGSSKLAVGGGVEVQEVRRLVDQLLEDQLLRQTPQVGEVDQMLEVLKSVESALGDLDSKGVPSSINEFFTSLSEVAAQPHSQAHLENAVWAGEALASNMRNLSAFISEIQEHVLQEASNAVDLANKHLENITEQNTLINIVASQAGNTNVVQDHRDGAMAELAEIMPVEVGSRDDTTGAITMHGWGIPLVLNAKPSKIKVEVVDERTLGVGLDKATTVMTDVRGGRLGGLLELYNEVLPNLQDKLDNLANTVMDKVNNIHVQGLGKNGSFDEMTGVPVPGNPFDEWNKTISAGTIHMRMIDQSSGAVTHHEIEIDPDDHSAGPPVVIDTIEELRDHINANIPGLSASLPEGALKLEAASGWKFDFLPDPRLTLSGTWAGVDPEISGNYNGETNHNYSATVFGSAPGADDEVGAADGLRVEVRNESGELVGDLSLGPGYSPGTPLELGNGLKVAFPSGTLRVGDTFDLLAIAQSDETNLLNACGINTFFQGDGGGNMKVCDRVLEDSNNFAFAVSENLSDNVGVKRMAALGETNLSELEGLSPSQYIRSVYSSVGQTIAVTEARRDGLQAVEKQLLDQRDSVSGVDINEEAANLIMYEKMFQAIAKYMTTQDKALQHLMNLI